ncbi:DNA polymerase Y family protein [Ottowia sp. GY511]|uniref:DNA polymerase Y family protein n=1 Tax=Ottowia flava TaxID=2675430 RepID=A0ABW4KQF4_9BURK|nr:DNA polymerase Y family protein [Ottowia sp. GY511]TXK29756.1 DNA polymerase Y family protein [Ottowia sp. GY511]
MHWLALRWPLPEATPAATPAPLSAEALAWWALGFTPHVAWVDEGLLMEVSACERLWGGRRALLRQVWTRQPADTVPLAAQGPTSLVALAHLRLKGAGAGDTAASTALARAADLPLHTLSAARPHLATLSQLGCRRWGDVAALPRAGLARRFGPGLGRALDVALGRAPDVCAWITPPDTFEQTLELPERADTSPALLWSARRLLQALQHWLAARHQGVRALELSWRFDQRRLNGQELPPEQAIELRTAEPVQAMAHLQRLLAERLARTAMLAPARSLRLRALDTAPWQADTPSFLPEDQPRGEPWHVFIERVSARLGAHNVRLPVAQADHRPESRQHWQAAEQTLRRPTARSAAAHRPTAQGKPMPTATTSARHLPDALSPTWLLRPPQPLATVHDQPLHKGQALRLISGPQRVEAGWWADAVPAEDREGAAPPVARERTARYAAGAAGGSTAREAAEREGHHSPPPGRPKAASAPSGGSAAGEAAEHGGNYPAAGPLPRRGVAPLGDSAAGEAAERGGHHPPPGRPKAGAAPSGGSGPREAGERGGQVSRDYFIAQSATAELLWIYRERPTAADVARGDAGAGQGAATRWFLHGLYA